MRKKGLRFYILTFSVTIATMLVLGELMIRIFSPTEYMHPRYRFSPEYGMMPFENVEMIHSVPGKYRLRYTINEYGCRGQAFPEDGGAEKAKVVVLGDSYSFGMGVGDGEEYAAVMNRRTNGRCDVVNLSSPGWGLTQQIRRYYDFGVRFHPRAVVLQFCANDPEDNFTNRVTMVEAGDFRFQSSAFSANWIKKYLSKSFIQRSQLYNFFRGRVARAVQLRFVRKTESEFESGANAPGDSAGIPPQEEFHIDLLETFAAKLRSEGTPLLMISVDDQLSRYPHIRDAVLRLHERGDLVYLEVLDWLDGMRDYASPEGHLWGAPAHEAIGNGLTDYIDAEILSRPISSETVD